MKWVVVSILLLAITLRARAADCDVLVYGATPAGIAAAVSAAREKCSVILVEPSHHLGGMLTGGLSHSDIPRPELIGGIGLEFFHRAASLYDDPARLHSREKFFIEPHIARRAFEEMLREAGVQLVVGQRLNRSPGKVVRREARLVQIQLLDESLYNAKVFIDATYEGDLMAAAGVTFSVGRESRAAFGESLAGFRPAPLRPRPGQLMAQDDACILPADQRQVPALHYVHGTPAPISAHDEEEKLLPGITSTPWPDVGAADELVQSYDFRLILTRRPENRIDFPRPVNYDPKRYELLRRLIAAFPGIRFSRLVHLGPIPNEKFDAGAIGLVAGSDHPGANTGYPNGDYDARQRIWQDHVDWLQGYFFFLANDARLPEDLRNQAREWGLARDEFADTGNWPPQLYVREARRMVGRHVMTQRDVTDHVRKEDCIALGSANINSHSVQRLVDPNGNVIDEGGLDVPTRPYEIPYRAITPRIEECENLLVPVCVSATHVAFASIRMEPQYMIMGHAAGLAAAQAAAYNAPVQHIDVPTLQQQLRRQKQPVSLADVPGYRALTPALRDLKGIALDDADATFVGEWTETSFGASVNGAFRHDAKSEKGDKSARFEISVSEAGRYQVRVSYAPHANRAARVPIRIEHADGAAFVSLDQRKVPTIDGLFESLGVYPFQAGRKAIIVFSNHATEGFVVIDAVQLIREE